MNWAEECVNIIGYSLTRINTNGLLLKEWHEIGAKITENLVNSMRKDLRQFIHNKGMPTKYLNHKHFACKEEKLCWVVMCL